MYVYIYDKSYILTPPQMEYAFFKVMTWNMVYIPSHDLKVWGYIFQVTLLGI